MTFRLVAATAIALCLSAPARAQTSPAVVPNVFTEAVAEIRELILDGCTAGVASLSPPPSQIGIGLEPVELKELDPSQRVSLLQYVDASLKQIGAKDRRIGYRNIFVIDREALPQQQRILSNTHLNMLVTVLTKGDKREFQLSATPAPRFADKLGFECGGSSSTYTIPDELIGERYFTFEEVVRQFASSLYSQIQVRRHRMMVLSPDKDLENVTSEAVSILLKEFDRLRGSYLQVGAEQSVVRVSQEKFEIEALTDETPWEIRITFSPQPREAVRVSVIGNILNGPGDASSVAQTGLVRQASLPARILQQAKAEAVAVDRLKRMQVSGVKPVMINDGVNRFQDTFARDSIAYSFNLVQPRVIEFDLEQESARPITLLAANGIEVKPSFVGNAVRPNLRRFSLGAGEYFLRLGPGDSQIGKGYVLRARSSDRILEPEPPGELLRNFGDWSVGVINNGPVRACYAFTTASAASRIERLQKPVMWFSITNEPGSKIVSHYLDLKQFYREQAPITAQIWSRAQMLSAVNVRPQAELILPVEHSAFRGYTQGSTFRMRGTAPSGSASEVVYSLVGYRQAMNAIALNCGKPDLVQSLVL
jgi:hypothetical protein